MMQKSTGEQRFITAVSEDLEVTRISPELYSFIRSIGNDEPLEFWKAFRTKWRFVKQMGYNPWLPWHWSRCEREQQAECDLLAVDEDLAWGVGVRRCLLPAPKGEGLVANPAPRMNEPPVGFDGW